MQRLAELTAISNRSTPATTISTTYTVYKLDSGKFQLSAINTFQRYDGSASVTPANRWRAKTIEELVALSASSFNDQERLDIRNVVYEADDAECASREVVPVPAQLRPYTTGNSHVMTYNDKPHFWYDNCTEQWCVLNAKGETILLG